MSEQQQEQQQQEQQQQEQQQQERQQHEQQQHEQQQHEQQNSRYSEFFIPFTFVIRSQSQPTQQSSEQTSPTDIHFFVYPVPGAESDGQTPPFIFFAPLFVPQENRKNVSESVMKKLPIVEITQEQVDTQATCPICLEAFSLLSNKDYCQRSDETSADKETSSLPQSIRQMPCKHLFCESCLFQWLKQNNTCPLCRKEIEPEDTSEQQQQNEQTSVEDTFVSSQEDVTMNDESSSTSTESNSSFAHSSYTHPLPHQHHQEVSINCALESVGCCGESQNNEEPHTNSPLITLPQCHHRFHASCLRTSLTVEGYSFESPTSTPLDFHCPTCRSPAIIQSDILKTPSANLSSPQGQQQSNFPLVIPYLDEMELD